MLRNQATALLRHEHLTTTVPRAKELRPFVERLITIAKRGVSDGAENGKVLHARRLVMHDLQDREVVSKLFETIAPRFAERPGGYAPAAAWVPQGRRRRSGAGRARRQRV
jgi:large subunit ribosomal protein L17